MSLISENSSFMFALREQLGVIYGSEELCILLYALVRRERPELIVELGTGMGVSSAWIGAGLRENESGVLHTFDNGSHYDIPQIRDVLIKLHGPLKELADAASTQTYEGFLRHLLKSAQTNVSVQINISEISLVNIASRYQGQSIDVVFSDFDHSPKAVEDILAYFLPVMNKSASIFIDSASTHLPSFHFIERAIGMLNDGKLPLCFSERYSPETKVAVEAFVKTSTFKLNHLIERRRRKQNSTAWIRIEPSNLYPSLTDFFH